MKKLIVCSLIIAGLIGGGFAVYFLVEKHRDDSPSDPVFTFAREAAPDWWSAGNTNPKDSIDPESYQYGPPEELPSASISIHHGGPKRGTAKTNCFVSASHHINRLENIDDKYQSYRSGEDEWGTKRIHLGEKQLSMQTPEGKKTYTLLQYRTKHTQTTEKYLDGVQVGFINLAKGHIRVQGTCKKSSDLDLTIPILTAVSLK